MTDLALSKEVRVQRLICCIDSRITIGLLKEEYRVKDALLLQYYHSPRHDRWFHGGLTRTHP